MEEIWEVIKSIGTQSVIIINYVISNKANIKLEAYFYDKKIASYKLTLGKGLYCNYKDGYNILIFGCGGDIYRHVYFMQHTGHQYIKGYQIHHIDYNHCNNSIDNLYYCSAKEHGLLHRWQGYLESDYSINKGIELYGEQFVYNLDNYNKAKEYYNWLETNKDNFSIDKAREYIKQIRKEIEQIAKPLIEQDRLERAKQREQKRIEREQQKYLDKLNSGNYIEVDGKLVRVRPKWTEERRNKTMKTRYETMYTNPEWLKHCKEAQAKPEYKDKLSKSLREYWSKQENRDKQSEKITNYFKNKKRNAA